MSNIPENADLLQQLMDNIQDNIFFKDSRSRFIMVNKANARWFGLNDPQEAVGKDDFDFFEAEHARRQMAEEQQIMQTGEPVIGEEQASKRIGKPGWGSVTKVPLRDKDGQIIGTMGIGRDISELKFKELQLEQAYAQMEEELKMAAKLQLTFLPRSYPSFTDASGRPLIQFHHFYEADVQLGGDFCSIYRLSENRAGLLICDVMGHGVRAALVTGIIHAMAEELVYQTATPGEFLTAMNRRLMTMLHADEEYIFATAAYLIVETDTCRLSAGIAGHPLPFLIRPQSGSVSRLNAAEGALGPALAIAEDYVYESFALQLEPGDDVLMYTDGLCEAPDTAGREFGVQRLQETIREHSAFPLDQLMIRIIDAVKGHAGGNKLGDDICLLGFQISSPAGSRVH